MSFQVKNSGGTELNYLARSVSFGTSINKVSKLKFSIDSASGAPIERGADIYVYDGATKLWGGTVEQYDITDFRNSGQIRYKYQCIDFDELASRRVVAAAYENTTAGVIVADLRSTYLASENVTDGTISTGAVIDKITFNYKSVGECLDELAELSGFAWCIDKDKALCFQARDESDAPFDITASNKPYLNIEIQRSRAKYRNTQYVRAGYDLTNSRVETQKGDGAKRAFLLEYEVGSAPTIRVSTGGGFSSKTVGLLGVDTGDQYYYSIGSNTIVQDTGETVLATSHTLEVTYQGRFPIVVKAQDFDEIDARTAIESGSGVYESVVDDQSIDQEEDAIAKANGLIDRFTLPERIVYQTDTAGMEAGMLQTITLTEFDVDGEYLIEQVAASDRGDGELRYTVIALSGQAIGGWAYFFKQLQKQSRTYVIRENEVLIVSRVLRDQMTLADSATATTYAGAYTVNGVDTYADTFHVG